MKANGGFCIDLGLAQSNPELTIKTGSSEGDHIWLSVVAHYGGSKEDG